MSVYTVSNTHHKRGGGVGQRWRLVGGGRLGQQRTVRRREREHVKEREGERERATKERGRG